MAKRNAWGPILFKYCRVQYNREKKRLEIMEGEFVGKRKPTRDMRPFEEELYDDDASTDEDDNDDDGQVPFDVVADDISPGLCLILQNE